MPYCCCHWKSVWSSSFLNLKKSLPPANCLILNGNICTITLTQSFYFSYRCLYHIWSNNKHFSMNLLWKYMLTDFFFLFVSNFKTLIINFVWIFLMLLFLIWSHWKVDVPWRLAYTCSWRMRDIKAVFFILLLSIEQLYIMLRSSYFKHFSLHQNFCYNNFVCGFTIAINKYLQIA